MNLLEFYQTFPDELSCEQYLIAKRWPEGFSCGHCGNKGGWYLNARRSFECSACHKQQSITAQTVFHKSKIPLQEWFLAMHLLATSKKGISGLQLQRQLPHHDMNTIYLLLTKLREAMAAREDLYQLGGVGRSIACPVPRHGDAFFGGVLPDGKRGRGSENKAKVLVAVNFGRDEDDPKYCKFKVVDQLTKAVVTESMSEMLEADTVVKTDGCRLYNDLSEVGLEHEPLTMEKPEDNQQWLPWVHIVIGNAKRFILGTHHSVRYLGLYLAEFAWRFNRRRGDLFERLIHTALWHNPITLPAPSQ